MRFSFMVTFVSVSDPTESPQLPIYTFYDSCEYRLQLQGWVSLPPVALVRHLHRAVGEGGHRHCREGPPHIRCRVSTEAALVRYVIFPKFVQH